MVKKDKMSCFRHVERMNEGNGVRLVRQVGVKSWERYASEDFL